MRKLIKIALVALGIRAAIRWWKRRQAAQQQAPVAPPAPDPADELRRKLAETRTEETDDVESGDPQPASVPDRRAEVHEHGRAALDEMKPSDEA